VAHSIVKNAISPYWVIVANQSKAEFCAQSKHKGRIEKIFSIVNDEAKQKAADLISDRGGRRFGKQSAARHALSGQHSLKDNSSLQFSRVIAQRMIQIQNESQISGFAIIAAPRFLGVLRKAIEIAGGMPPSLTVDKDVVDQDERVIERILANNQRTERML